jgi:hypothetical protein
MYTKLPWHSKLKFEKLGVCSSVIGFYYVVVGLMWYWYSSLSTDLTQAPPEFYLIFVITAGPIVFFSYVFTYDLLKLEGKKVHTIFAVGMLFMFTINLGGPMYLINFQYPLAILAFVDIIIGLSYMLFGLLRILPIARAFSKNARSNR